jgi:hypothetical protein
MGEALRISLTFGDENHLALVIKRRLSLEEAAHLRRVFELALESLTNVEAEPAPADAGEETR